MPSQTCPLCTNKATFVGIDFGRKKKFNCVNCHPFVISSSTEKIISELSQELKEKLSEASRQCEEGMVLLIWREETTNSIMSRCESEQKWA